ncbi:MAG: hypothetical protein WA714_08025, partial [Candidatus Acidiferrales bacterium]
KYKSAICVPKKPHVCAIADKCSLVPSHAPRKHHGAELITVGAHAVMHNVLAHGLLCRDREVWPAR